VFALDFQSLDGRSETSRNQQKPAETSKKSEWVNPVLRFNTLKTTMELRDISTP
jgi:hypothetical protein